MTHITVGDLKRVLQYYDDNTDIILLHNEQETGEAEYPIALGEGDSGVLVISSIYQAVNWGFLDITNLAPAIQQLREEK